MLEISYHRDRESDIWNNFKSGDRDAFNLIYYRYAEILLNHAYKVTSDKPLAEDCLQELFVDLWSTRRNLTTPKSVKHYLLQSFRRRIVRKLKYRDKKLSFVGNVAKIKEDKNFAFSIETKLIVSEDKENLEQELRKRIDGLSDLQREVIYHRFFNELSIDEIAILMNLPKKSVYNALANGISALRKAFE